MERTTRPQLESMVGHVNARLRERGYAGPTLELEVRSTDYDYRYAITADGGATYPLGERFFHAGDLWEALRMAMRSLELVPAQVTA